MGRSGQNKICEPMLHMVGQAQSVMGMLQGIVGVDSLCIGGSVCKGRLE